MKLLITILLVLGVISAAFAVPSLYEDDVSIKDWIRPFSGIPTSIKFIPNLIEKDDNDSVVEAEPKSKYNTPVVLVSKDENAITITNNGLLHRKWRQVLPSSEILLNFIENVNGISTDGIITISKQKSSGNNLLRYFNAVNGFQEFEIILRKSSSFNGPAKSILVGTESNKNIFNLYDRNVITVLNLNDNGRLIWDIELDDKYLGGQFKNIQLFDLIYIPGEPNKGKNELIVAFGIDKSKSENTLVAVEIHFDVRTVTISKMFDNLDKSLLNVDLSFKFNKKHNTYNTESGTPFAISYEDSKIKLSFVKKDNLEVIVIETNDKLSSSKLISKNKILNYDISLDSYLLLDEISNKSVIMAGKSSNGEIVYASNDKNKLKFTIFKEDVSYLVEDFKYEELISTSGSIVSLYYSGKNKFSKNGEIIIKTSSGDIFFFSLLETKIASLLWYSEESLTKPSSEYIVDLLLEPMSYQNNTSSIEVSLLESFGNEIKEIVNNYSNKFVSIFGKIFLGNYLTLLDDLLNVSESKKYIENLRKFRKSQIENRKYKDTIVNASNNIIFTNKLGTKKIALFASETGKLTAIDTEYGYTIWGKYLTINNESIVIRKILLKEPPSVNSPPIVYIIGNLNDFNIIFTVNTVTGEIINEKIIKSSEIEDIISITLEKEDLIKSYLCILKKQNDNLIGTILDIDSNDINLISDVSLLLENLHYYSGLEKNSNLIKGYSWAGTSNDISNKDINFLFKPTWTISLPKDEVIAAFDVSSKTEPIASLGRILGDRNVLYKYLNANLISFITVKEEFDEINTVVSSSTAIYIVDAVSGNIHYSNIYPGAGYVNSKDQTGILLHQTENIISIVQFNHGFEGSSEEHIIKHNEETGNIEKELTQEEVELDEYQKRLAKRLKKVKKGKSKSSVLAKITNDENAGIISDFKGTEIIILEIYESIISNKKFDEKSLSSFDSKTPSLLQRAYTFPEIINILTSTTTEFGITTKEFIFGLNNGKIISINKQILNARRPITEKLSSEDQEEMLIIYKPNIDISQIDYVSYNLRLPNIKNIQTIATRLESTSLLLSSGLDLYCTLRTPSKGFDLLSKDFNHGLLIVTIIILIITLFIVKSWSENKEINTLWR